jgi:CBS domain-containing protein
MNMQAHEVMQRRVIAVGPEAVGRDLVLKLLAGTFSGFPVVDEKGIVVGVVTEFDLIKAKQKGKDLKTVRAREIMSQPPITVRESTSIEETIARMMEHQIVRVPVVKEDGKLAGIISRSDLLFRMVEPEGVCFIDG